MKNTKISLMKTLKFTLSIALSFCFSMLLHAQSFEGLIEFTKTFGDRVVTYKYFVKGDQVRIEEIGPDGQIYGVQVINTKSQEMLSFSPERKLYMDVPRNNVEMKANVDSKKTGKTLDVAGHKSEEVVVSDKDEDRQITFYLANKNFDFMMPMLKTLNRRDKLSIYYQMLNPDKGSFPMKAVEVIGGKEESVTLVTKVEEKKLGADLFRIPEGYQKFEK
jgi:hypothetical protein